MEEPGPVGAHNRQSTGASCWRMIFGVTVNVTSGRICAVFEGETCGLEEEGEAEAGAGSVI